MISPCGEGSPHRSFPNSLQKSGLNRTSSAPKSEQSSSSFVVCSASRSFNACAPTLKETIKNHNEWNSRRFAAFNLGSIGEKHPELVRDIIPVMIDYIKKPFEVTKRKPRKIEVKGITITFDISDNLDQTKWLKDAYIDTLGMFGKGDK